MPFFCPLVANVDIRVAIVLTTVKYHFYGYQLMYFDMRIAHQH
jgi:hypothetical protein